MRIKLDPASNPYEIEERSFAIIESEIPEPRPYAGLLWQIARRCIHAMGDTSILPNLVLQEKALDGGMLAMRKAGEIYTDTRMLAAGLVQRRMQPLGIRVFPLMELPGLDELAARDGITRSAAAIRLVVPRLDGKIIAIGNAPTALLTLMNELKKVAAEGQKINPALVIGMPVGFVNAEQSKELLLESGLPHFTLKGRRGGSAVAAACINAMAEQALRERKME